jgi:TolA-binding protein
MTRFHAPSAEARGAEHERLLGEAAKGYNELLKQFPTETNLCAQSMRALGSIHATQGKTNEAVKFYAAVGEKYASEDWEVLQAWKSAADLLWDGSQRNEAKKFYAKIVERFGKKDAPQIIQQVVRGSKARLAE